MIGGIRLAKGISIAGSIGRFGTMTNAISNAISTAITATISPTGTASTATASGSSIDELKMAANGIIDNWSQQ